MPQEALMFIFMGPCGQYNTIENCVVILQGCQMKNGVINYDFMINYGQILCFFYDKLWENFMFCMMIFHSIL